MPTLSPIYKLPKINYSQSMKTIGVYGSLKEGSYNHNASEMVRVGTSEITGAMDLMAGAYPRLYPKGYMPEKETTHVLELYTVSEDYYNRLDRMEKGAGYQEHTMSFDGHPDVTVWLMNPAYEIDMECYITSYPAKQ